MLPSWTLSCPLFCPHLCGSSSSIWNGPFCPCCTHSSCLSSLWKKQSGEHKVSNMVKVNEDLPDTSNQFWWLHLPFWWGGSGFFSRAFGSISAPPPASPDWWSHMWLHVASYFSVRDMIQKFCTSLFSYFAPCAAQTASLVSGVRAPPVAMSETVGVRPKPSWHLWKNEPLLLAKLQIRHSYQFTCVLNRTFSCLFSSENMSGSVEVV